MGDAKKIIGYVAIGAAIVLTVFFSPGAGIWSKLAYYGSILALSTGGSMLLNQVAKKEMAEQLARAQSMTAGLQANTRSSQTPIPLIYGWQKIGGNYLYMKATGSNNNELHCVLGLCEGEIAGIERMYFGDTLVWDAQTENGGILNTPYLWVFAMSYRLGTNVQTPFSEIQAIDPDFEDTYPNTAVVYLKLIYDQNLFQGVPQVNFLIRGRKVYDPRDLQTKFTQNGILQLRDVMTNDRFGVAIPQTKMDDITLGEAANYADQVVTRSTPLGVTEFLRWGWADIVDFTWAPGALPSSVTLPRGKPCPNTIVIGTVGHDDGAGNITGGGFAGTINYATKLLTLTAAPAFPYEAGMPESAWWITYRDGWRKMDDYLLYAPIVPGSIAFSSTDETVSDNGLGVLTGSLGGSGTIDYSTGRMIFTWKLSPPRLDPIKVSYQAGSGPRFLTNYFAIDGGSGLDAIRSLLSQFRGFLIYSGGYYKVKIDKPETTVASFQSGGLEDGTNNIIDGTFSWQVPGISEIPTRVRAKWIDPMENWKVKDYLVDLPGIDSDRRELTLELYSCNNIDVVERIARTHAALIGSSIKCMFKTNLQGLILEPGDKVTVTHPAAGWVNKEFRVVECSDVIASETVSLSLIEYNAANYIDDPQTASIVDHGISQGAHSYGPPPEVTGLTLTEFWRQLRDGTWSSWIRATFAEPTNYPYTAAYEIYLRDCTSGSNQYVKVGETRSGVYEVGPVKEATLWSVMVVIRTINGVRFFPSGAYAYIAPTGKTGLPTAPAFVDATCTFTDRVVLNWSPIPDTDLGNYELRTDTIWGNATNRLYLGKGTSFWVQATAASYTVYLKSIDTSGNYSTTFATKTLTNGAPTAPSVTTDYIGRDCIVKWGASPDLDFSKWVLTIYSDAARTVLKRTVEMQSPGFIYTYDQIRADFGGAGVPGTIYFRIVTHDRFGSTTTTDFSATQASPAIVQYDGGSVERVRIGDLGSGAYGARFKDSAGNITFEQGDTLKQKYMKMDETHILKTVAPWRWPFADEGMAFGLQGFDGNVFVGRRDSNNNIYGGVVSADLAVINSLAVLWNQTDVVYGLDMLHKGSAQVALSVSRNSGATPGFYRGLYDFSTGAMARAMTIVESETPRSHYTPISIKYDSAESGVMFVNRAATPNEIHYLQQNDTTGAITVARMLLYSCPVSGAFSIIGYARIGSDPNSHNLPYRIFLRNDATTNVYSFDFLISNQAVSNAKSHGAIGVANYPVCAIHVAEISTSPIMAFISESASYTDTIQIRDADSNLLLSIITKYAWAVNNPNKQMYSPLNSASSGLGLGYIPYLGTLANSSMYNQYKLVYLALYKYEKVTNATVQDTLASLIA
ncbi:MAG: phage tail protein [Deltaproteobacteria bacterium]|nr:phage tail protein [Deltaproteobacteria bacterium]